MSYLTQKTLKKEVLFSGIALHSGLNVNICIKPAVPNFGIVFKRVDLNCNNIIYPSFMNVSNTSLNTTVENEFGAKVDMSPTSWVVARRTDEDTAEKIRELRGTRVLGSIDGTLFALFDSTGRLTRTMNDNPDWVLERVVETVG